MNRIKNCTVVPHPELETIIVPSETSEGWGTMQIESTVMKFSNGIVNKQTRSALIRAELENLEYLAKEWNLDLKKGGTVQGCIFVNEQTEPFYEGQEPKKAGVDGEVLVDADGDEIYRQTTFVPADQVTEEMEDKFIQHVNDIKGSYRDNLDQGAVEEEVVTKVIKGKKGN